MSPNRSAWLLMMPGLFWLVALMVVPCALIFSLTIFERGTYGGIDWNIITLENFRRAFDPLYAVILWDSARLAGLATLIALLIGYPAAYAISKASPRWQTVLLFFGDSALLDQLSDPHLCLDRAAQSGRAHQQPAAISRAYVGPDSAPL